jgi:hypothetical protein
VVKWKNSVEEQGKSGWGYQIQPASKDAGFLYLVVPTLGTGTSDSEPVLYSASTEYLERRWIRGP